MEHKNHHWVPQSYLNAWGGPQSPGRVWLFTKDGKRVSHAATNTLFCKGNLYTVKREDGTRDLAVETGLLHGIETNFVPVRDKIGRREPLTMDDRARLCAFAATMLARTLPVVKGVAAGYEDLKQQIDTIVSAMHKQFGNPSDSDPLASVTHDPLYAEVRGMAKTPAASWVAGALEVYAPVLANMRITLLVTDDGLGFITSDNPCVLTDPAIESYPRFFRQPQITSAPAQITLPLSPRVCALFSWSDAGGYRSTPLHTVTAVNRRMCAFSSVHVVVRCDEFRPEWRLHSEPEQGC